VRITAVRKLAVEAADNGPAVAGTGQQHLSRKGRGFQGRPPWELAECQAGLSPPERARCNHQQGAAGSSHPRRSPRLRTPPFRSGRAYVQTHPAAGWPLVHRGSGRQARTGAAVPMPTWVKVAIEPWAAAGDYRQPRFPLREPWRANPGHCVERKVVWQLIRPYAEVLALPELRHTVAAVLAKIVPSCGRRIRADPNAAGVRFGSNDRSLFWAPSRIWSTRRTTGSG
jgi:hypothetical protein